MKIILISPQKDIQKEQELINALFEKGLDYLHLRKPDHTKDELENYLKQIKPAYYRKISVHSHYNLLEKYNLGGMHLTENVRKEINLNEILKVAKKRSLNVSTSIHSISEMKGMNAFSYIFLSPVFDSISKPAYKSAICLPEFSSFKETTSLKPKVIALGGIEKNNLDKILEAGFDGFALMGYLWNEFEKEANLEECIDKFLGIKLKVSELSNV
jgi:thiamine-phosphate pyrophosphorylase